MYQIIRPILKRFNSTCGDLLTYGPPVINGEWYERYRDTYLVLEEHESRELAEMRLAEMIIFGEAEEMNEII